MTALAASLLTLGALIQRLEDHGLLADRKWVVWEDPNAPWICVDVIPAYAQVLDEYEPVIRALGGIRPTDPATYRFAIRRATADLYAVGMDGAVGDDPITIEDVRP